MHASDHADGTDRPENDPGSLELLVARCLELSQDLGSAAVDHVCDENPEHAAAIRERLSALARVGLLGAGQDRDQRIGPYELLEHLGSGGMAVVWAARKEGADEIVALKTADPRLPWTDRMRERFRRETEAARRLDHPRIVTIRDVGESCGLPYYTMDYVEGATLGALLDALRERSEGSSTPSIEALRAAWLERRTGNDEPTDEWGSTYIGAVCRIALDVAEALDQVHESGIVHRDVKPSNILVDARGRGNLFDLGLAHLSDDARLTRTGEFAGSPQYAAPEQISGSPDDLDARADVYGLGATLFELVALRPPFLAAGTPELLRQVQHVEAPLLRNAAPWAPRDLEVVCECCLEKDPRHRYATARELALDLSRFLGFEPVRARPVGALRRVVRLARRNPAPTLTATLLLLILIATPLALWLHTLEVSDERDRASLAAIEAQREATENREVSRFLESLILRLDDSGDPAHRDAARDLLREALARLDRQADIQPLTRAGLFHTVARVLAGMGREIEAVPLLDRSLAIREGQLGEGHPDTAAVIEELAALHLALGNHESARGLAERGLRAAEGSATLGRSVAAGVEILGLLALEQGELEVALEQLERAAEVFRELLGAGSLDEARILRELGRLHHLRGEWGPAEQRLVASLEIEAAAWEPNLANQARGVELLAALHEARGAPEDAAARWAEALRLHQKRGRTVSLEAELALCRLAALRETRLAGGASADLAAQTLETYVLLGENRAAHESDGAAAAFARALELAAGLDAPDSDLTGRAHLGLGRLRWEAGLVDDALENLDAALRVAAASESSEPWISDLFAFDLRFARERADEGRVHARVAQALAWFDDRIATSLGANDRLVGTLRRHALLLFDLGYPAEAEPLLRGADELELRAIGGSPRLRLDFDGVDATVYAESFQRGITHLQSSRYGAAVLAFETCRALRPADPIAAYNLACAFARSGDPDAAFEALEVSVELGYAYRDRADELILADPDLEALRDDARFSVLLERVRSLNAAAEAFAAESLVHVPAGVDPDSRPPLLVVLHAGGQTKHAVVEGPWRAVADELGCVLLAPSGRLPTGIDPEDGMQWIDDIERYQARTWYYEQPVRAALAGFRRTVDFDPERVYIAGEGLGGTLAFHLSITSPEVFRGVLLLDAAVPVELAAPLAPNLGSLGLRVALVSDPAWRPPGVPRGVAMPDYLTQMYQQLDEWGLDTSLRTRPGRSPGELTPLLVGAMRFLQTGLSEWR